MTKLDVYFILIILAIVIVPWVRSIKQKKQVVVASNGKGKLLLKFGLTIAAAVAAYFVVKALLIKPLTIRIGNLEAEIEVSKEETMKKKYEDCIVVREDRVWIDDKQADDAAMIAYIAEHVEANRLLILVDEYSSSEYFRKIEDLCKEKGVKYTVENETWLENK